MGAVGSSAWFGAAWARRPAAGAPDRPAWRRTGRRPAARLPERRGCLRMGANLVPRGGPRAPPPPWGRRHTARHRHDAQAPARPRHTEHTGRHVSSHPQTAWTTGYAVCGRSRPAVPRSWPQRGASRHGSPVAARRRRAHERGGPLPRGPPWHPHAGGPRAGRGAALVAWARPGTGAPSAPLPTPGASDTGSAQASDPRTACQTAWPEATTRVRPHHVGTLLFPGAHPRRPPGVFPGRRPERRASGAAGSRSEERA